MSKKTRVAVLFLLLLALAGVMTVVYVGRRQSQIVNNAPGITTPPPTSPALPTGPVKALIYTVVPSGGDENDLGPATVSLAPTTTPAHDALVALIDSPQSPLPAGTRLLGVKIESGLATVNLSPEFKSNFHGGDLQEAQAINSILMTLGQFSTVDRVQFLVDGAAIDSLGGHFELSDPVDVVRPSSFRQASNPS